MCHWCSYHILTSSVIYYWIDARQHGIYLFYIITKQTTADKAFISKSFNVMQKLAFASPLPTLANTQKAIWCNLLSIPNEAISLVAMHSKELWLAKKITPLSNLTRASLLVEWKLTAKAELNCEIYKSLRNCWKSQVSFCHQSSPVIRKAWTLLSILQELKKYPRQTCGCGQPRGYLIWVLNARSICDGGYFCLLWLVILKSGWYNVGNQF